MAAHGNRWIVQTMWKKSRRINSNVFDLIWEVTFRRLIRLATSHKVIKMLFTQRAQSVSNVRIANNVPSCYHCITCCSSDARSTCLTRFLCTPTNAENRFFVVSLCCVLRAVVSGAREMKDVWSQDAKQKNEKVCENSWEGKPQSSYQLTAYIQHKHKPCTTTTNMSTTGKVHLCGTDDAPHIVLNKCDWFSVISFPPSETKILANIQVNRRNTEHWTHKQTDEARRSTGEVQ